MLCFSPWIKSLCLSSQTKAADNKVHVVLFIVVLDKVTDMSMKVIHLKAILAEIDHICIFGVGLELACNGGLCGEYF